jgi:hypothetical protein
MSAFGFAWLGGSAQVNCGQINSGNNTTNTKKNLPSLNRNNTSFLQHIFEFFNTSTSASGNVGVNSTPLEVSVPKEGIFRPRPGGGKEPLPDGNQPPKSIGGERV